MEATAGNISLRSSSSPDLVRITASGRSKGELTEHDIVEVDLGTGRPTHSAARPSAETAIHLALYRAHPDCGAVVHAHMPHATVLAATAADHGRSTVTFTDFELIKGLGCAPNDRVDIPVFANDPDVAAIGRAVHAHYAHTPQQGPPVLLIAHHGATAWGVDLPTARNKLECLEELSRLQLLAATHERTQR